MAQTIDAHQHYWDVSRFDYGWARNGLPTLERSFLPADLEPQLEAVGIDRTVLVQVLHSPLETEWMLGLADRHRSIAGVVGWVDLTADPELVARDIDLLRERPHLVGIRHLVHEEADDDWLAREDVLRGLSVLEAGDVPFDLLLRPKHIRHVPRLSERFPALRMVIDHIAKPRIRERVLEPWATEFRASATNPNLWCKLSGMITEADHEAWQQADLAPYVEVALEAFGGSRLMYGSDWPVCTLAGAYASVVGGLREVLGTLDSLTEEAIFGGNARTFYRFDEEPGGP
jgi:L-fuconolactonase